MPCAARSSSASCSAKLGGGPSPATCRPTWAPSHVSWATPDPLQPGADQALARVGLAHRRDEPAGRLSHGDKRKLELAILLAADPKLILLDEPMAGVSAGDVPALTDVVRSIHREEGRTVLMVEHHMEVLLGLADHVIVTTDAFAYGTGPDVVVAFTGVPIDRGLHREVAGWFGADAMLVGCRGPREYAHEHGVDLS